MIRETLPELHHAADVRIIQEVITIPSVARQVAEMV